MVARMDSLRSMDMDMNMNMTTMNHSAMGHDMMSSTTMSGMDHSGMDHGGMDNGGMDHGGMDQSGMNHDMGMMKMYFNVEWKMTYVLFEQCMLMEGWQLAVACILLALIAALYEGLKVFREHLLYTYQVGERSRNGSTNGRNAMYLNESSPSSSKVEITSSHSLPSVRSRIFSCLHVSQTALHMLQITISYVLMLVVMTYNLYLCLSVVLGAGIGYFAFGWKRSVINDRNEHCH